MTGQPLEEQANENARSKFICPKCFREAPDKESLIEHMKKSHLAAYTQVRIKQKYREKLAKLASSHNRSMANMIEVLIDQALTEVTTSCK